MQERGKFSADRQTGNASKFWLGPWVLVMKKRVLIIIGVVLLILAVAAAAQNKAPKPEKARDPVCGLMVEKNPDLSAAYQGETYYFCTKRDRDEFKSNPQKYVKR